MQTKISRGYKANGISECRQSVAAEAATLCLHSESLPFEKVVILINYRDNNIYIKNPIYLFNNYFVYYLNQSTILKFDKDDLFYYSSHKIQYRGGHLFVSDYGMQYNILNRYGIKPYAVKGKDYATNFVT